MNRYRLAIYHHGTYVGRMPKLSNCKLIGHEGTGRLGHFSTQGEWDIYEYTHKNGAITVIVTGTGYWNSRTGSGWDWESRMVDRPADNCTCHACTTDREVRAEMNREMENGKYLPERGN